MNYHIGTMLIYEHFDGGSDCPVCKIKNAVDARLTESYLGEKVMEDDTRKEVNKLGFCKSHYEALFLMRSKLGLALQTRTRLTYLKKLDIDPNNVKSVKKAAVKLRESGNTCVVCKYLSEHMIRYYKTIAEVYAADEKFRERIVASDGFCLNHYSYLAEYSAYAGKKQKSYLADISEAENKRLEKLGADLDEFCMRHDYRNADKPMTGGKDALKNAKKTFYGI